MNKSVFELIKRQNSVQYAALKKEIAQNSGIGGNLIYNAYTQQELSQWKWPLEVYLLCAQKSVQETNWRRSWALMEEKNMIASVDMVGGKVSSSLHRCMLTMGVSKDFRGRGLGKRVLQFAVHWARENHLSFVDLCVLDTNIPALGLYRSFGFIEIGRKENAFYIYESNITEIQMTLEISKFQTSP